MNHFIIRLITGEVVYGKLSSDSIETKMIIIHDPLTWEEYVSEEGHSSSALVRFCNGTDETEIPIVNTAVISMSRMSKDFTNFYDSAVALQKATEKQYSKRLRQMTDRMHAVLNDYWASSVSAETGDIVCYPIQPDSEDTIH
jgi:hypothetical protein